MTVLEALEKINHTICLNTFENLKWGIDKEEKIDCQTPEEFIECYQIIKNFLERKFDITTINQILIELAKTPVKKD